MRSLRFFTGFASETLRERFAYNHNVSPTIISLLIKVRSLCLF
ncbi:MAG: hypothetical protein V7K92_02400 [Nostoc sp.]